MSKRVRVAFEREIIIVSTASLLPRKKISDALKATSKYKRIARSVSEIGILEPLSVARLNKGDSRYLLLDGHVRLSALLDLGQNEVRCLISDDDEAFTYNKRVNRLATVQEHFMIKQALKRGVSEKKLASALNVDITHIKRRQALLDRICPEAVELLKDKSVNPGTFDVLRKMKPLRQIECAELLVTAGNFSASYTKALLAATRQDDLAKPDQPKKVAGMSPEQMARMEREMSTLHQDFRQIENSYGDDILHLVIASGFLAKLIDNHEIERFLTRHYAEILHEFRAIVAAASLDQTSGMAA